MLMYSIFYFAVVYMVMCLLVWAWTLKKLYADIKEAQGTLPNEKVFRLHGVLLVLFLVVDIAAITTDKIARGQPEKSDSQLIWYGIANLLMAVADPLELLTFFLVALMLNPFRR